MRLEQTYLKKLAYLARQYSDRAYQRAAQISYEKNLENDPPIPASEYLPYVNETVQKCESYEKNPPAGTDSRTLADQTGRWKDVQTLLKALPPGADCERPLLELSNFALRLSMACSAPLLPHACAEAAGKVLEAFDKHPENLPDALTQFTKASAPDAGNRRELYEQLLEMRVNHTEYP